MGRYLLRRLLLILPTLFGIMVINFVIVQFAPGGPVEQIMAIKKGADYITSTGNIIPNDNKKEDAVSVNIP